MSNSSQQGSLFNQTAPMPSQPIVLTIKGIEVPYTRDGKSHVLRGVPSFKTGKTAFAWRDKATGKIMARPLTLPEHRKWMELAILSLESQLCSALQITAAKIQTVASPRSWIASRVPLDDSWTWCPEITVRCELCAPGEEGATITVERIR
jgi:hypothetical protein